MSEEIKAEPEVAEPAADEVQSEPAQVEAPFYTFKGRTFRTEGELNAFIEALAYSQGSIAQKFGELEKETAPLRKYNLKNADVDDVAIMKQVAQERSVGNNDAADALLFEYVKQVKKSGESKQEKARLWADYVKSRADIFDVLDEDMAKDYVFANYDDKLSDTKDPFQLMDTILVPKASKLKPKSEAKPSGVAATLGSGRQSANVKATQKETPGSESGTSWDSLMKEFNVKS